MVDCYDTKSIFQILQFKGLPCHQKSMLCFMVLLILLMITCNETSNVGSVIFYNRRGNAECWTEAEMAKLRARKLFQDVMPSQVAPDKVNARFIKDALRYYRGALRAAEQHSDADHQTGIILKQALLDAIGGHLRNDMLPTVRFAYYAGYVPYRRAREIHDLFETSKTLLNTKGLGWKEPEKVPKWGNLTVVKVLVGSGKLLDPCAYLVMQRDSNSCIHLPSPKLDDKHNPSAIALPFKVNGLVSLTSPQSENVLLKYYTSAARCILRRSPLNCRHSDFVNFNNELWHWMKRDVAPHLVDEKLYAAYGGVLRIAAAVQSYGKGLSRRNLFQYEDSGESKWHPWKALSQSYVSINADWTPSLYLGMVLLAASVICSLQICYNYTIGSGNPCKCVGRRTKRTDKNDNEVAYATVDTTFPSILPNHNSCDMNRNKQSVSKNKSSRASITTQRVYDLNDNAEKFMDIIMSDNEESEESETDSQDVCHQEVAVEAKRDGEVDESKRQRQMKLPELHTPMSQLKIEKKCRKEMSPHTYTTSASTQSEVTCRNQEQRVSESMWSLTESTSTDRSCTSMCSKASKTLSRYSRSSRDLAWARRVLHKQAHTSIHSTTGGTEFDINSYTTPPASRR